jgi:hypothetical protein
MYRYLTFAVALLFFGLSVSGNAEARNGHHSHFSFSYGAGFGNPYWWGAGPYWQPYPYYYEPRTIIIEREPPVYIQRQAPAPAQLPAQSTWYYCPNPVGYYPYVPNCSQQWVAVDPRSVPPAPPAQ